MMERTAEAEKKFIEKLEEVYTGAMRIPLLRNSAFAVIYIAAIFMLVGTGLIVAAIYTGCKGYVVGTWPQTRAVILTSDAHLRRTTRGYNYQIEVNYQYTVDGHMLNGENVGLNPLSYLLLEKARTIAGQRFAPGTMMNTYYNPSNPSEAYLEAGIPAFSIVFAGMGVLLFASALWLIRIRKRIRREAVP